MRNMLIVLWSEFYKSVGFAAYYRLNTIVRSLRFVLQFVGFSLLFGRGMLKPQELQASLIGYMLWPFIMLSLIDMTWLLTQEVQTGSFEQFNMSILSARVLLLARMVAIMVISMLETIFVMTSLALIFRVWPLFSLQAVPVIVITLIGLMGFTLIVAALTLEFKHTEALTGFTLTALSFLNGAILPVAKLPVGVKLFALTLPTTEGIAVLRKMLIDKQPLLAMLKDGSLLILLLHTVLMFSIGWYFYRWIEERLKKRGTLGQY
jgi:ABC-2 type transport system permease protein